MGFFDDFVGGISSVVNAPIDAISGFFDDPLGVVGDVQTAIVRAAAWFYQAFVSGLTLISSAIIQWAETAVAGLVEVGEVIAGLVEWYIDSIMAGLYGIFNWLTDWSNTIYTGFRSSIEDTVDEIGVHVEQFSAAVVDKAGSLLVLNSAMAVLKKNIESPDGFKIKKTVVEMASASLVSYFAATFFRSLI